MTNISTDLPTTTTPIDEVALRSSLAPEILQKASDLLDSIKPAEDDDPESTEDRWVPETLMVNSGKGDKAPENSKKGDFFIAGSTRIMKKPLLFFPLFSHTEIVKWGTEEEMGKTLCKSIDGITFKDFENMRYFNVSEFPVAPGRFTPKDQRGGYEYAKRLYFVDQNFEDIYSVVLKSYALAECYDVARRETKRAGVNYNPRNKSKVWLSLDTVDKTHNFGTSKVFKATASTVTISEDEAKLIDFFKQVIKSYYDNQIALLEQDAANLAKGESRIVELEASYTEEAAAPKGKGKATTTSSDANKTFETLL